MIESMKRADRRAATAQRILAAAKLEFGQRGVDGATIRGIAERAGVDPSLVIQHYGTKDALFAVATRFDADTSEGDIRHHLADVLRRRLDGLPPETYVLMRSMLTSPEAAAAMKEYLDATVDNLAAAGDDPDVRLRAALTASSLLGLTVARYFLHLDALANISEEQRERVVLPWIAAGFSSTPEA
jgi:AcrR family transcriptional regulator